MNFSEKYIEPNEAMKRCSSNEIQAKRNYGFYHFKMKRTGNSAGGWGESAPYPELRTLS